MRPRGYYVVFLPALALLAVCHGYQDARRLSGGPQGYKRFLTRQAAEEFAEWWSYDHTLPGGTHWRISTTE